jgi:hypothetical protein
MTIFAGDFNQLVYDIHHGGRRYADLVVMRGSTYLDATTVGRIEVDLSDGVFIVNVLDRNRNELIHATCHTGAAWHHVAKAGHQLLQELAATKETP